MMGLCVILVAGAGVQTMARDYLVDALRGSEVVRTGEPRVVVPEVYYVVVTDPTTVALEDEDLEVEEGVGEGSVGDETEDLQGGDDTGSVRSHIYIYRYARGSVEPVPVEGPEVEELLRSCRVEKVWVGTDEVGSREANERVMEGRVKKFITLGAQGQGVERLFGVGRVAIVVCEQEVKP